MTDDNDKIILERIGKRLANARGDKRLTQAEVARKASISDTHYAQVERGEKAASILVFLKILSALNVSSSDILKK